MATGQHGERTDATTRPDRSADHPMRVPLPEPHTLSSGTRSPLSSERPGPCVLVAECAGAPRDARTRRASAVRRLRFVCVCVYVRVCVVACPEAQQMPASNVTDRFTSLLARKLG